MLSSLLARLLESWQGLSLSQKAYTLLLGLVLLLLLPRLLLLLLVPIERALLAVLIAAEELTAVLLLKTMSLVSSSSTSYGNTYTWGRQTYEHQAC